MENQAREARPQHRSTMRVLDILEALANSTAGLTMADVCREVSAPKGSISPILHTMADSGYVAYDESTKRYTIGLKTYLLGKSYDRESSSMGLFVAAMREVTNACGETCQLGVLDHGRVLYVAKVDSPQPVRLTSSIGRTLPIHYTAIGKVLVSELPEAEVRTMLAEPLERPTAPRRSTVPTSSSPSWARCARRALRTTARKPPRPCSASPWASAATGYSSMA